MEFENPRFLNILYPLLGIQVSPHDLVTDRHWKMTFLKNSISVIRAFSSNDVSYTNPQFLKILCPLLGIQDSLRDQATAGHWKLTILEISMFMILGFTSRHVT